MLAEGTETQDVSGSDWDYLVVLDACRYDFFKRVFREYLSGDLEARRTEGSSSSEWAAKNFGSGFKDVTYVSANPFVNSIDVPLKDTRWGAVSGIEYDWKAADAFGEVVDVWYDSWDESLGTVHPRDVNKAAHSVVEDDEGERTVVHYMQPHLPYISAGGGESMNAIRGMFVRDLKEDGDGVGTVLEVSGRFTQSVVSGSSFLMKLGVWMDLRNVSASPLRMRRADVERYYLRDLRLVLEHVSELIERIDGDIVVTSDHGEAFGEKGYWEHTENVDIPALREVPWMEIN